MLRIKELRKYKDFTQKELSDKSGIKVRAIQSYEAGERFPSSDKIPAISRALGVSIGELFGEQPNNQGDYSHLLTHLSEMVEILNTGIINSHTALRNIIKANKENIGEEVIRDSKQRMDMLEQIMKQTDMITAPIKERVKEELYQDKLIREITDLDSKIKEVQKEIIALAG